MLSLLIQRGGDNMSRSKKNYPQNPGDQQLQPVKLFLWINGVERLDRFVEYHLRVIRSNYYDRYMLRYEESIRNLQRRISAVSTKTPNGCLYYYEWTDEGWKYHGAEDPRVSWRLEISDCEKKLVVLKNKLQIKEDKFVSDIEDHVLRDFQKVHLIVDKILTVVEDQYINLTALEDAAADLRG
jgi:hypothetical protein